MGLDKELGLARRSLDRTETRRAFPAAYLEELWKQHHINWIPFAVQWADPQVGE